MKYLAVVSVLLSLAALIVAKRKTVVHYNPYIDPAYRKKLERAMLQNTQ